MNFLLLMENIGRSNLHPTPHEQYGILVRRHMIQILNGNGLHTNGYQCTDFSKRTVDPDRSVKPRHSSENWYPIELKSPVLDGSRTALEKFEKVIKLLVSMFKLYLNESCGLHVHVGNEDRGFTMRTLKDFGSLITLFEHQLESAGLATFTLPSQHQVCKIHKQSYKLSISQAPFRKKLSIINKLKTVRNLIVLFRHSPF